MKKNLRALLYYFALISFSIKIPLLGITGPYLLSLAGAVRPRGVTKDYVAFWSVLLAFFLLVFCLNIYTASLLEFWKSLINIILFAVTLPFVAHLFNNNHVSYAGLNYISVGIFVFALIQIIALIAFGTNSYFFLLDSVSISTADDVGRFQAANLMWYMRPISIYHEPSFFGLVSLVLLHVNYIRADKIIYVNILSIILSMSTTAIFFMVMYFIWHQRIVLKLCGLLSIVALMILLPDYTRLDEIIQPGTSGHERLVKPIIDLGINYSRNFVAVPVGNLFPQTNNSLQLLFAYFGIASFVLIPFALKLYRVLPVVLCILFTNGAFLTPDGALLLATAYCTKAAR